MPTPITRPPAIAQDIVVAQRKPLELTHERDTHEKKQNFDWLSVGWGGVEPDLLTSMAVGSEAKMEPHCVVWVGVTM